jgi:hypothetical protein
VSLLYSVAEPHHFYDFIVEYLREYEFMCKNAFKKNPWVKGPNRVV